MLEIIDKEGSSELIERYRMKTNQQISQDFVRGLVHEIKKSLMVLEVQLLTSRAINWIIKIYKNTDIIIKQTDRLISCR